MADFAAIRDGLKANLAAITGLRVHDTAPDTISPPAVVIVPADGVFLEFDTSLDGDSDDLEFTLHLFVARRSDRAAQDQIDAYLARSGASSIFEAASRAAIAGTHFAVVTRARDYGDYTYATEQFLGCKFDVFVGAA